MGSETAVRRGVGKILVDGRRGDDPAEVRRFTFAGPARTEALIERTPECGAAAVRAIVNTQKALRTEPALAAEVERRRFPKEAAELIATVVERDLPFYDPAIYKKAVAGLSAEPVGYYSPKLPISAIRINLLRSDFHGFICGHRNFLLTHQMTHLMISA